MKFPEWSSELCVELSNAYHRDPSPGDRGGNIILNMKAVYDRLRTLAEADDPMPSRQETRQNIRNIINQFRRADGSIGVLGIVGMESTLLNYVDDVVGRVLGSSEVVASIKERMADSYGNYRNGESASGCNMAYSAFCALACALEDITGQDAAVWRGLFEENDEEAT
jgi:hypothetical protein